MAALIGASGGAVATICSTIVTLAVARQNRRLQEDLAVANEVYRQVGVVRDERREAYAQFLLAVNLFNRAVMEAAYAARDDEMEKGVPSPGDRLREAMHELWLRYQTLVLMSDRALQQAASTAVEASRTGCSAAIRGEVQMIQEADIIEAMRAELGY
jgi:hypothetical protein